MRFKFVVLQILFLSLNYVNGQAKRDTVVAQKGDGIFSILRNSGIDPVKYYEEFYKLNEKNIRNGSELIIGKNYLLPEAPDSFKKMGSKIAVSTSKTQPIFDQELPAMKMKDSTLKNTVYYLMYAPDASGSRNAASASFMTRLAKELLVRSAKVYILEGNFLPSQSENIERDKTLVASKLGDYVGIINKKYLMNNGAYQRVIVFRDYNSNERGYALNAMYYDTSTEGQMIAVSLQDIFSKNTVGGAAIKNKISTFKDATSIFLAKNVLPPIAVVSMNNGKEVMAKDVQVKSEKPYLAKIITDGILNDYSNTTFND